MAETMNRPNAGSIFSRLEYLSRKMDDPKISPKEMRILKLREKNLLEMMEEGMEEFGEGGAVVPKKYKGFSKLPEKVQKKIDPSLAQKYEDGGAVMKKKGNSKKTGVCRGAGAAVKGTRFSGVR